MGNILYTKQNEKGPINFFAGNIIRLKAPDAADKPFNIAIKMSLFNPDTKKWENKDVSFAAWNGDRSQLADRLGRMKLAVGRYVYGVCGDLTERKTDRATYINASLFSLGYSGEQTIEDGGKSYLLLCGRVGNINLKDDKGSFSLAVDAYTPEEGRFTKWYNINIEGPVFGRIKKGGKLVKGVKMTLLGQLVETKKETKHPVVSAMRVDFSVADKESK